MFRELFQNVDMIERYFLEDNAALKKWVLYKMHL